MTANTMRCPSCQAVLKRNPAMAAGTKVKCPKCGGHFVPDEPDDAPTPPTAIQAKNGPPPIPTVHAVKAADADDLPRPRKARREDDEEDDDPPARRPRKEPAKSGSGVGLVLGLVGGGLFLLLLLG